MINPEIVDVDNEDFTVWDDCFSFPNLLVRVSRAFRIKVRYQDVKGEWQTVDLEGDRAELLQHEIDHLDGVLILDRTEREQRKGALRALREGTTYSPPSDEDA